MSKAWGSAAIRLGMAFASKEIIDIYNKVKYPYNVNQLTQQQAMEMLKDPFEIDKYVKTLLQERSRLMMAFRELPICEQIYPTDANFFLTRVTDAKRIYDYLVDKGIIVRNRSRIQLCQNCLRITIGTRTENNELLSALRQY
jgi:histidinol-phosphate aminotransferase